METCQIKTKVRVDRHQYHVCMSHPFFLYPSIYNESDIHSPKQNKTKHLGTAQQVTWDIHPSVHLKVGRLDFRGGSRGKEAAAEVVAVSEVVVAEAAMGQHRLSGTGGGERKWRVGLYWVVCAATGRTHCSEDRLQWLGGRKGKKTKRTEKNRFLAVWPRILTRGPPMDIWDYWLEITVDTPKALSAKQIPPHTLSPPYSLHQLFMQFSTLVTSQFL